MAENPTYVPLVERFISLNGEGSHTGNMSVFFRYGGCNLSCRWCDTQWANACDVLQISYTTDELIAFVLESNARCITITGGEPLLQPSLIPLVSSLLCYERPQPQAGFFIEIETNGSLPVDPLLVLRGSAYSEGSLNRLGLTIDYKLPSSGMADAMILKNYSQLTEEDAIKFVIGDMSDLQAAEKVIDRLNLVSAELNGTDSGLLCKVYFSPAFRCIDPQEIARFIIDHKLAGVALQLQLHKIVWPHRERGV